MSQSPYWGDNVDEEFFLTILDLILTVEEAKERVENGLAMADPDTPQALKQQRLAKIKKRLSEGLNIIGIAGSSNFSALGYFRRDLVSVPCGVAVGGVLGRIWFVDVPVAIFFIISSIIVNENLYIIGFILYSLP